MKNYELIEVSNKVREGLFSNLKGTDFLIAFIKNVKLIENEISILEELRKPDDDYNKFAKTVVELRKEYADLDENGTPKIVGVGQNSMYSVTNPDKKRELESKFQELRNSKKWKSIVDKQEEKVNSFVEALNKDCDLEFKKISKNKLPNDMDFEQIYLLNFMIED